MFPLPNTTEPRGKAGTCLNPWTAYVINVQDNSEWHILAPAFIPHCHLLLRSTAPVPGAGGQGHCPHRHWGWQDNCLCFQLSATWFSSPAVIYSLEDPVTNSWSHLVPPRQCSTSTGRSRVHTDVIFAPLCQRTQR